MKVTGKDIGETLDELYATIESRVRIEAERDLRVEPFEGGASSNVAWQEDAVVISLHQGVPTHAMPHIFGVALQHVRQRLDRYPTVVAGEQQVNNGALVRTALRELVLAPEADQQLARYDLDQEWEVEQRHAALKGMLRDVPPDWDELGTIGNAFAALQYARFSIDHPEQLWTPLRDQFAERLPSATERGEAALAQVRSHGWASPGGCLESLSGARDALQLQPIALIEDRRSGARL